jgi:preprotein translocase subunit SecE|tara:strand:+ start:1345 stop:1593 length:249 start_codon:yes stop_codon:yes gene_type:complete
LAGSSSLSTRATLLELKKMSKIGLYIKDAFNELVNKVSWPTWSELQNSSIVVAIATVIIALIIYFMDSIFSNLMKIFYSFFS